MSGLHLYWRYLVNGLRAQMLYPTAFMLRLVTQFLVTIVEFGGLYALFARFNQVEDVSKSERDAAWRRIRAAAKRYGIEVSHRPTVKSAR